MSRKKASSDISVVPEDRMIRWPESHLQRRRPHSATDARTTSGKVYRPLFRAENSMTDTYLSNGIRP
jgi:hypothetical protein